MNNDNGLIISKKHADMIKYATIVLEHFPKNQRVLADMMRECMYRGWRLIDQQQYQKDRLDTLRQLDFELRSLLSFVRLANDMGFIRGKPGEEKTASGKRSQYSILSALLVEEGRIVGGMIKKAQRV
ncbi:MAG: hypothetical protein Q4D58_08765 [Synergistaceae bacterium]|nr:hypothetical protein [Synergistaceae bacterium]